MWVGVDLNWLLQFVVFASAAVVGFLCLVQNTASGFFLVDSNFGSAAADFSLPCNSRERMAAEVGRATEVSDSCAVCGLVTTKQCSGCKMVKYCSEACQRSHWNSEHKTKCKGTNSSRSMYALRKWTASLVPTGGSSKILKQSNKILFPYEDFVQYFNWEELGYPPCGLLNCGNSCFANVVLQCLAYTRPLVAYLLEKGHKIKCGMEKWCFLCEFQTHVERANYSHTPFSPINILSRLRSIGGNLGFGEQEDAHEFMRFAIDSMQSICLDEFGGEKAVHPMYQETTLVQHIFGGRLQSQVICIRCNNVSNQLENMMDLTVEIHGVAESLEECLDQFTAKEWLHGDNKYKCDSCNDYVMAQKRLAVQRAPNILTIALKRFQSGRYGKLNKRVTFPETLDLSSYMSELEDGNDIYKLYAVVVHVDLLNASFFGHYICYVKDFHGNWYRVNDCKVDRVDFDEVLSQGAYMLLYSRICARPSCLLPDVMLKKQENENVEIRTVDPSLTQPTECSSSEPHHSNPDNSGHLSSANCSEVEVNCEEELSSIKKTEDARGDIATVSCEANLPIVNNKPHDSDALSISPEEVERDTCKSLGGMSSEEFGAAMNCTSEEDNACDFSSITNGEVREENSANPSYMPENAKREGTASDENTKDAAKNSNGESSGAKLKPPFSPGFLGKQPWKEIGSVLSVDNTKDAAKKSNGESSGAKYKPLFSPGFLEKPRKEFGSISRDDNTKDAAKKSNGESSGAKLRPLFPSGFLGKQPRKRFTGQEIELSAEELSQRRRKLQLNNQTSEVWKPYFLPNGSLLKDEEKHHFLLEN